MSAPARVGVASLRPLGGLGAADRERWQALADAAVEPNPYFSPALALAAHRHLGGADAALAVVADGERWLACLPVQRRAGWRRVGGPCLAAWGHTHGFLDTPLVHPDGGREAIEPLVARLMAERVAYVLLATLSGGGTAVALEAAFARHGLPPLRYTDADRALLVRRAAPTYLEGVLNPKRRRELRRQRRVLEETVGAPLEVVDRSGDPDAYATFLALEASGWKGEEGTAFASVPGQAAFATEAMAAFAERGELELLSLEGAGRPVAMKCNFRAGDETYCFKIGHDEALARLSPGIQLELAYMERFHAAGEATFSDSCAVPGNAMINRLWPDRRRVISLIAARRSPRGARAWLRARAIMRVRARMRRVG